ncbi:solute carrier family 2, facilitated glucose transporter member 8-like [Tubulanus polymorphus]|uniref:solute carrier family 2, facilitated glucose transporter member 8-like n=1 Tax=Tubulanus polymorphus TaxID=672921 RepID=UPI003DA6571D
MSVVVDATAAVSDMGVERAVDSKYRGSSKNQIFATLFSCLGSLCFGYAVGYSSPAVPDMEWNQVMAADQLAWFSSLLNIGGMIGSFLVGGMLDRFGRKKTILLTTIPFIVGWGLITISGSVALFYIGRTLTGVGSGIISAAVAVYITEISTSEMRGTLASCGQLFITIGILIAYAGGLALGWKMLALLAVAFPALLILSLSSMPETPRWLLMNGARNEAKAALSWLRGRHVDVEGELRDIEESINLKEPPVSLSEFRRPELKMPLKISLLIALFQQLGGINAIMFYAVNIMLKAGFKESGNLAAVIIGAVQVVATVFSVFLMDRLGRRTLLTLGGLTMGLSCTVFGYYFYSESQSYAWIPLLCVMVYVVGFSLGWGPIPALVMSELFPVKARSKASSMTTLTMWTFSFIITKEFEFMQQVLGKSGVFWFFGSSCFIGVAFILKYLPETKGKSLEDIELYFLGKSLRS